MNTDLKLTALDGDLSTKDGDFEIGVSTQQEIHDILFDYPGFWQNHPTVGIGLPDYQNADVQLTSLSNKIMQQLANDGFSVSKPKIKYDPVTSTLLVQPNATKE